MNQIEAKAVESLLKTGVSGCRTQVYECFWCDWAVGMTAQSGDLTFEREFKSMESAADFVRWWNRNGFECGGKPSSGSKSNQDQESGDRAASMSFGFVRSTQTRSHSPSSGFPVIQFIAIALLGFLFVVMSDRPSTTQPTTYQVEIGQ